ncbi:LysR family transcriptional regulator [Gottfriedia acidiceleris]|uniref:LysR family transcriptional regulator n=1 Tax=Gottfriedia acidiceleris TaxID=371036 RepID=UPI00101E079D|nr:LysR family transcriptional regulator [Gottfriedia acidiceleris]
MNFEQMEHIVIVADERSITKAADRLHISTSGLSQSITKLENELGIEIFNRSKKIITPTFNGEKVISTATFIINTIKDMNNEIDKYKSKNVNDLKILTSTGLDYLLEETIITYKLKNKDINFDITKKDVKEIIKNFLENNYDFAFLYTSLESLINLKNIGYKHIHRSPLCVGVGKKSPFYSLEYINPSDLKNSKILWYKRSNFNLISKLFNLTPDQMFINANNGSLLLEMAKESDAIFFAPEIVFINFDVVINGDIKLIPIKENNQFFNIDFWLIYFENKGLSNLAEDLIENFLEYLDNVVKRKDNIN